MILFIPLKLSKILRNKSYDQTHDEDGLALTKFIYWIKQNKKKINEIDAEKKLENFRKKVRNIFILV